MDNAKRPSKRSIASVLGSLALIGILIVHTEARAVIDALSGVRISTLLWAITAILVAFVLTGVRWWLFLQDARLPHGIMQIIWIRQIGQTFNNILPGAVAGDVIQMFLVARRPRQSSAAILSSILADRVVGLMSVIAILAVTAGAIAGRWPTIVWIAPLAVGVLVTFATGAVFLVWRRRFSDRSATWAATAMRYVHRIIRVAARQAAKPRLALAGLFLGVLGHILLSSSVWLLLLDIAPTPFLAVLPVFALASLSSLAPISIGGLGLREWVLSAGLASFGLTLDGAVALSLSLFVLTVAIPMGIAGVGALVMNPITATPNRTRNIHKSPHRQRVDKFSDLRDKDATSERDNPSGKV